MKRKPPKPKTPKSPGTPTGFPAGELTQAEAKKFRAGVEHRFEFGVISPDMRGEAMKLPGFAPAPRALPAGKLFSGQPTPEWLAEMAARLMADADKIAKQTTPSEKPILHAVLSQGTAKWEGHLNRCVQVAYDFYAAAKVYLLLNYGPSKPLPAFFSPEEIANDCVPYERACVLITGEPKPKRAIEKLENWERALMNEAEHEGRQVGAFPDPDEGWPPRVVLFAMGGYEEFQKKPIDLTKRQYAPHPGHSPKPKRQRRKRRGPRLPKLSQK